MDTNDKEYFKKLLLEMREEILNNLADTEKNLSSTIKEASGEHSSYSFHLADMGTDSIEREKNFMIASMNSLLLGEIDHALEKFNNGEYGSCEQCEVEIDKRRLEAIPYARLCIQCKSNDEIKKF